MAVGETVIKGPYTEAQLISGAVQTAINQAVSVASTMASFTTKDGLIWFVWTKNA